MAGYYGYSMSNNAVLAYENGEKPLSKWTKTGIIAAIKKELEEENLTLDFDVDKLKKIPIKKLKDVCLSHSSWHHTSSYYNQTEFYFVDVDRIIKLTEKEINSIIEASSKKEEKISKEIWKCAFLEWSGSRKHPKATEIIEEGIVKGDWFYRKNGTKKKITANGFRFIEKIQ